MRSEQFSGKNYSTIGTPLQRTWKSAKKKRKWGIRPRVFIYLGNFPMDWAVPSRFLTGIFGFRWQMANAPGARSSKVPKLFGWHNSLCILKAKAFQDTKLYSYFTFSSLYIMWKDQLYRTSGLEFYGWLFGPEKFSGLSRNGPLVSIAFCAWLIWSIFVKLSLGRGLAEVAQRFAGK